MSELDDLLRRHAEQLIAGVSPVTPGEARDGAGLRGSRRPRVALGSVTKGRHLPHVLLVAAVVAVVVALVVGLLPGPRPQRVRVAGSPPLTPVPAQAAGVLHVGFVTGVAFGYGALWAPGNGILRRVNPATDRVAATIPVAGSSDYRYVAVGGGAVWVTDAGTDKLTRINPATDRVTDTITLPPSPVALTVGFGKLWVEIVAETGPEVIPVSIRTDRPGPPIVVATSGTPTNGLAAGYGGVWLTTTANLLRIDPRSGKVSVVSGPGSTLSFQYDVAAGDGAVWATVNSEGLARVDTRTLSLTGTPAPISSANMVAVGPGAVWVVTNPNNTSGGYAGALVQVNPVTGKVVGKPITVGETPVGIAVGHGAVWVASYADGSIEKIDVGR